MRLAAACLALAACRDVPRAPGRPATLDSYPRAMQRLSRLVREQFTAADPIAVERQIRCESRRVEAAIGKDFSVRQGLLMDSLRQEFTSEQFNQLGRALAVATFPADGDPACAREREAAEREAPLVRIRGQGSGIRN
ncbi:MAG: hypothetical protein JWL60_544 [Gemmatimonadetes bacterium]|jgi:hypothetical protein|nr:hypothetical protein [Gemmatimonadota bacterium]